MKTFQGAKTKIFTVTNERSPSPHWSFLLPKPEKKVFAFKSARALFVGQWFSTCEPEVESRTQGSRPRPKTQKKSEAKVKDSLSEDRHSRGQGQECSRPRTLAQVLSKKKSVQKNFSGDLKKKKKEKGLHINFSSDLHKKTFSKKFFKRSTKFLTIQKIVLSSSRGQANFRELEASRPRTSKCVLEAKDVLEDSTSAVSHRSILRWATEPFGKLNIWVKNVAFAGLYLLFPRNRCKVEKDTVSGAKIFFLKIAWKYANCFTWYVDLFPFFEIANRSQNTGKLQFSNTLRDGPWEIFNINLGQGKKKVENHRCWGKLSSYNLSTDIVSRNTVCLQQVSPNFCKDARGPIISSIKRWRPWNFGAIWVAKTGNSFWVSANFSRKISVKIGKSCKRLTGRKIIHLWFTNVRWKLLAKGKTNKWKMRDTSKSFVKRKCY